MISSKAALLFPKVVNLFWEKYPELVVPEWSSYKGNWSRYLFHDDFCIYYVSPEDPETIDIVALGCLCCQFLIKNQKTIPTFISQDGPNIERKEFWMVNGEEYTCFYEALFRKVINEISSLLSST